MALQRLQSLQSIVECISVFRTDQNCLVMPYFVEEAHLWFSVGVILGSQGGFVDSFNVQCIENALKPY